MALVQLLHRGLVEVKSWTRRLCVLLGFLVFAARHLTVRQTPASVPEGSQKLIALCDLHLVLQRFLLHGFDLSRRRHEHEHLHRREMYELA